MFGTSDYAPKLAGDTFLVVKANVHSPDPAYSSVKDWDVKVNGSVSWVFNQSGGALSSIDSMTWFFIPLSRDEDYPAACPAFFICKRCEKRGLLRMFLGVVLLDTTRLAARSFIVNKSQSTFTINLTGGVDVPPDRLYQPAEPQAAKRTLRTNDPRAGIFRREGRSW